VALAGTVPLFVLLFASAYFVMARASPANFSTHHSAGSSPLRPTDRVSRHSSHHSTATVRRDRLADITERS
jgi:hypothetical protein